MNKQKLSVGNDTGPSNEEENSFAGNSAGVPGEYLAGARKHLESALDHGREIYGRIRDKTIAGSQAANEAVHKNSYQAIAIGVGVGALIGYFIALRYVCDRN